MRGRGRAVPRLPAIQTATYEVKFEKRQTPGSGPWTPAIVGRIPRVTRLLALAHRIEGMIRSGEIRDWAEAARLAGVTRARMTQIANLLLLAPAIQEAILSLPTVSLGRNRITEQHLRSLVGFIEWDQQRLGWE